MADHKRSILAGLAKLSERGPVFEKVVDNDKSQVSDKIPVKQEGRDEEKEAKEEKEEQEKEEKEEEEKQDHSEVKEEKGDVVSMETDGDKSEGKEIENEKREKEENEKMETGGG